MNANLRERKFKDFITSLSSSIVMTIMFGVVAIVLVYDATINNIATLPLNQIGFLIVILSIMALIGIGYIITMLIRIESLLSNIHEKIIDEESN